MTKIVLAQIDSKAGDIEFNREKIIKCIERAKNEQADLIIFPAFALTGYPLGNILSRHQSIQNRQKDALKEIAGRSENITAVIGFAEETSSPAGSIALIKNQEILFKTGIFELNGKKYGITADAANIKNTAENKLDVLICSACSESRCGSNYKRNEFLKFISSAVNADVIYVNKTGCCDNYVFDGASCIYDKTGKLLLRAKYFEEDFVITDDMTGIVNAAPENSENNACTDDFKADYQNDLARTYKSIVYAVKQYFAQNGFSKAVIGLSGGLDSSVCAVILTDALGAENVYGISMPAVITSKESRSDAAQLAENLGINFQEIPISSLLKQFSEQLDTGYKNINAARNKNSTAIENLQARLRASILWSIANEFQGMLPIASSDKSEAYIGYATVNGDMSGGFAPIADITKTKLFMLADYLNKVRSKKNAIPKQILEKPPGAELKLNPATGKPVCAEEENMPYEFLDEIIRLVENKGFGKKELETHSFLYERENSISKEQKKSWIDKFFYKSKNAVYKHHIMPPSVITDNKSILAPEYRCPIISKVF